MLVQSSSLARSLHLFGANENASTKTQRFCCQEDCIEKLSLSGIYTTLCRKNIYEATHSARESDWKYNKNHLHPPSIVYPSQLYSQRRVKVIMELSGGLPHCQRLLHSQPNRSRSSTVGEIICN